MPFPDPAKEATEEAMANPRVGDRFTEMYAFWLYVIEIQEHIITTLEASAPCTVPEDGKIIVQTLDQFQKRFAYANTSGYWIRLVDRNNDVVNWAELCANASSIVPPPGLGSWSAEAIEDYG